MHILPRLDWMFLWCLLARHRSCRRLKIALQKPLNVLNLDPFSLPGLHLQCFGLPTFFWQLLVRALVPLFLIGLAVLYFGARGQRSQDERAVCISAHLFERLRHNAPKYARQQRTPRGVISKKKTRTKP